MILLETLIKNKDKMIIKIMLLTLKQFIKEAVTVLHKAMQIQWEIVILIVVM